MYYFLKARSTSKAIFNINLCKMREDDDEDKDGESKSNDKDQR